MELEDVTVNIHFVNSQSITFRTNAIDLVKMQEHLAEGKPYRIVDVQLRTFVRDTAPSWMEVDSVVVAMRNVTTIAIGR